MSMNIYEEAKGYFEELLDNYDGEDKVEKTLSELHSENDGNVEYNYSVYNSDLFQAMADNLNLLGYAEDIEKEFGQGIATNPLLINEAILQYILDEYGENTPDYFNIEIEEDEVEQ